MFLEIFERLCAEKKVSPNKALADIGMSNATYTNWKKRGSTPQGKNLQKIAEYFGVTTGYLLGERYEDYDSPEDDEITNRILTLSEILSRTDSGIARLKIIMEDMERAAEREQQWTEPRVPEPQEATPRETAPVLPKE